MKRILIFLFGLVTMIAVSCQKEQMKETGENDIVETVITGYFENATKTILALDELTPQWMPGDTVRIMSENNTATEGFEDIVLTKDMITSDGRFTCTTTVTNPKYAVYPASLAKPGNYKGGALDPVFFEQYSSSQDGSFARANVCAAEIDGNNNFCFHNLAAIIKLRVGENSNVEGVRITGDLLFPQPRVTIKQKHQPVYYIAYPPVGYGEWVTLDIELQQAVKVARISREIEKFEPNTIYDLGDLSNLPFTIQKGEEQGWKYVQIGDTKWCTDNLAIYSDGQRKWKGRLQNGDTGVQVGNPLQWGAYKGCCYPPHYWSLYTSFNCTYVTNADTENSYNFISGATGFDENNRAPYYDKDTKTYNKYNSVDKRTTLLRGDDLLYKNSGEAYIGKHNHWKIPSSEDFRKLLDITSNSDLIRREYSYDKVGLNILDAETGECLLFFPANITTPLPTIKGDYMTSDLDKTNPDNAICFYFWLVENPKTHIIDFHDETLGIFSRYLPMYIRPVVANK